MTRRHEYFLDLPDFERDTISSTVVGLSFRSAQAEDMSSLAELMIAADQGTIDYDGETLDDAIREVKAYLAGKRGGRPMFSESRLAFDGAQLVGACLVAKWQERQAPLIAYIMTRARWKNKGVARTLLSTALQRLSEQGYQQVRAVVTQGNIPSERLFDRLGFAQAGNPSSG